ncbi:unnamed protein product [Protopolystoma xenopodis]|uniref:Uncharacterized protein n=1 Tax=Protopolystoma xenopodis TaxID=117903 RepID=A0A3S4ZST6_9PLAT|nr:unnamed protein product [Protopolystoma xenopodis]
MSRIKPAGHCVRLCVRRAEDRWREETHLHTCACALCKLTAVVWATPIGIIKCRADGADQIPWPEAARPQSGRGPDGLERKGPDHPLCRTGSTEGREADRYPHTEAHQSSPSSVARSPSLVLGPYSSRPWASSLCRLVRVDTVRSSCLHKWSIVQIPPLPPLSIPPHLLVC